MVVVTEDEDEAFRLFQDWLLIYDEVKTIWSCGWALGQDGPDATTQNQRAEAVDACALLKSVVPSDLGAQELGVAPEGPRKLAIDEGWQGRWERERKSGGVFGKVCSRGPCEWPGGR